jgi:RNA polymerase sigma factor (sigma-70 family)
MKDAEFEEFLQAVRAGDQQAAEELVHRFEPAIRHVIRIRLRNHPVRRVLDSMDICQSILAHFFKQAAVGRFEIHTPEDLGNLLVTMALNRLRTRIHRERNHTGGLPDDWQPATEDSSPSQKATHQDLMAEVRLRLSPDEQCLYDLKLLGHTWPEIARQIGGNENALRIRLTRAIARVSKELHLNEASHE